MAGSFISLLGSFDLDTLEAHQGPVVGLWPDYRMAYQNPAWFAFASANDSEPAISRDWPIGRSLMEAVPEELKPFYRGAFNRCLVKGKPWHHDYECSSDAVLRHFHLTAYPLVQRQGLLIVHSLTREILPDDEGRRAVPFSFSQHRDRHGFVHQCANCRRVQNLAQGPDCWDWVPSLIKTPYGMVSHSICPICLAYYHP